MLSIDKMFEAACYGVPSFSPWNPSQEITICDNTPKDADFQQIEYTPAPECAVSFAAAAGNVGISVHFAAPDKSKKSKKATSTSAHGYLVGLDKPGTFWLQPYLTPFQDDTIDYILVELKPTKRADTSPINDTAIDWLVFEIALPAGFAADSSAEITPPPRGNYMVVCRLHLKTLIETKQREMDAFSTTVNVMNKGSVYKVYQKGRRNQRQTLVPIVDIVNENNINKKVLFM